jgi:hypothetical protein
MLVNELVKLLVEKYGCSVSFREEKYVKLWCGEVLEIPKELEEKLKRIGAIIDAKCAGSCSGFGELKRIENDDKVIYIAEPYFYPDYLWITIEIPFQKDLYSCNCSECPIKDLCSLPSPIYCPYFNCAVSS